VGAEASLGVSGAAVLSIGAGSEAAALRLRRGAFGAAGAGAAAAARFGALRGLAAFTFTFGAAALRAVAFAFGAALRTPVVALARADVAFAGFAAALRVAGLAALRVEVFAAAAAARFGAALRAAGFAVARLAAGFAARVVFVAAFFVTAFFAGAFFATAFLAAVFVVFAAAFFAGAFFVAAFAFGFTAALVARGAAFVAALRVPAPRPPRVPVPAARRVVARTASAWARGWSLLLSSLFTSGFSLSAVGGYGSLLERPRVRPHPQDAKGAQQQS